MVRIGRLLSCVNLQTAAPCTDSDRDTINIISTFAKYRPDLVLAGNDFIEVSSWVSIAQKMLLSDLVTVNNHLQFRSYLVGNRISLADVAVVDSILEFSDFNNSLSSTFPNVFRWLEHVTQRSDLSFRIKVFTQKQPTFLSLADFGSDEIATPSAAVSTEVTVPTPVAGAVDTAASAVTGKSNKKDKKAAKVESGAANPVHPEASTVPAVVDEDLNPTQLDIRVGVIVKCWEHPDADKLLCEEIDMGEASVRTIASGLRAHYPAADMVGKKVLVLANLKDRTMVGFKSQVSCCWLHFILTQASLLVNLALLTSIIIPGHGVVCCQCRSLRG